MALFEWTESLDVHIAKFNGQHRKLVDLINRLHSAMKEGKGSQAMDQVLSELTNYTITHFSDEEKLMAEKNYPGLEAQRKEHQAFIAKVEDLAKRFEKGGISLSIDTSNFLKDWLVNHIMGSDKQYSEFFNGLGIQ